jgi:glycosyltransferase involved in cell wall biosynthesis
MNITQFNRRRNFPGSIEILFESIRKNFSDDFKVKLFIPTKESKGIYNRLHIILESYFQQGDVNHITGDIHFASYFLNKKNTILTVHDCVSVIMSKGLKKELIKFFWFTLPAKKVKYITVISEKTKTELLSIVNFPEENIFVIPDCISDAFEYNNRKFNKTCPRILQIGTKENKNIIRLAKALNGINCVLDIVGKLSKEQENKLKENNIIYENSFNISESDLIMKYLNSDIISFISTYEGFGMPLLEGQTVGRIVLTSNISPMIEVAGDGAFLVDPFNVDEIKEGILSIIKDDELREKLINKGLENIKQYEPKIIAEKYELIYKKIMEK